MMVKYGINLGTKVTYDEIKDLHLGECDTCMKCKMRAFALPLSISRRIYEVFEFLSCDHIPFSKTVGGSRDPLVFEAIQASYYLLIAPLVRSSTI